MKIEVLFFAAGRDIIGKSRLDIEVKEGESASGVLKKVQADYEDFLNMPLMLAVNEEYVPNDYKLKEGDVLALIPLVSGG